MVKLILQIKFPQNSQIILWKLQKTLLNPNYCACLNNESTNSSILEQESAFYTLQLTVKYFSVDLVKTADTAGIIDIIETVFNQFGIMSFTDIMLDLNID